MNGRILSFSAFVLIAVTDDGLAESRDGAIRFAGQMIEAACELDASGTYDFGKDTRWVRINAKVQLAVNTARYACARGYSPFLTSYEPLLNNKVARGGRKEIGIVTITYQ